ncbi:MAG: hypothetical protein ACREJV_03045 [Candidatus Rokuibacteriota bacterium]
MVNVARPKLPWMLVASSLLLLGLLLYVMFMNYLPAKQRVIGLERELKEVYAREVSLQTRLVQSDPRLRDQQVTSLRAEREALVRRIEQLERELAAARDSGRR